MKLGKLLRKRRKNKESLEIEAELLEIASFLPKFNKTFCYSMKEYSNQKGISKKRALLGINAYRTDSCHPHQKKKKNPHTY